MIPRWCINLGVCPRTGISSGGRCQRGSGVDFHAVGCATDRQPAKSTPDPFHVEHPLAATDYRAATLARRASEGVRRRDRASVIPCWCIGLGVCPRTGISSGGRCQRGSGVDFAVMAVRITDRSAGEIDSRPLSRRASPRCGRFLDTLLVGAQRYFAAPQHFLNFLPLPQGQGSLRPTRASRRRIVPPS